MSDSSRNLHIDHRLSVLPPPQTTSPICQPAPLRHLPRRNLSNLPPPWHGPSLLLTLLRKFPRTASLFPPTLRHLVSDDSKGWSLVSAQLADRLQRQGRPCPGTPGRLRHGLRQSRPDLSASHRAQHANRIAP